MNDAFFGQLDTSEFPLRDGHLLDVELLGPGFWVPFGFQVVAELVEFLGVFAGQHDGAGAEAVTEGVHANRRFAFGSFWAGRL